MDELELLIPESIVNSLPADSKSVEQDMKKAVAGWEADVNEALSADDEEEAIGAVLDLIEFFEDRWEAYDEFVVELRAWGQSPIYAMAWRDLHAAVIQQIYDHDDLANRLSRERNARIVEDGIRFE
ncbi:MAG: hypothetical protein V5A54_06940 [Haloarculaceae archaeon]